MGTEYPLKRQFKIGSIPTYKKGTQQVKTHTQSLVQLIRKNIDTTKSLCGTEIGVWQGENSRQLLTEFPNLHLLMVDRYRLLTQEEAKVTKRLGKKSQADMYEAMQMAIQRTQTDRRTIIIADSIEATKYLKDEFLDFVFIDCHHSYEAVKFDLQTWFFKVKEGGLVCGHDYEGAGDRRKRFGVQKAVDEFVNSRGFKLGIMPGHVWWFLK